MAFFALVLFLVSLTILYYAQTKKIVRETFFIALRKNGFYSCEEIFLQLGRIFFYNCKEIFFIAARKFFIFGRNYFIVVRNAFYSWEENHFYSCEEIFFIAANKCFLQNCPRLVHVFIEKIFYICKKIFSYKSVPGRSMRIKKNL